MDCEQSILNRNELETFLNPDQLKILENLEEEIKGTDHIETAIAETVSFLLYGNRNDLYYNRFSQVIAHIQIVCACAPFTSNVLTLFICLHFFH